MRTRNNDIDIQKRTFHIPPLKIDKPLIRELGEFLETQENLILTYRLNSETQEVERHTVEDFVNVDWGQGLYWITITSKSMVKIRLDLEFPSDSQCVVYGKNLKNVNGILNSLKEIFQKYRLGYASVKTKWIIKLAIPAILTAIFGYSIFTLFNSVNPANIFNPSPLITIFAVMISGPTLYFFVQWLFPYFEYGEPSQKSVRKWIWFVLVGLGILPSIIQRILGL